eukprot:2416020-Amphidinium_carterae.2
MQHVHSMSTARREATRGRDTFADSTLNNIAAIHVQNHIQGIQGISTFKGKFFKRTEQNPLVVVRRPAAEPEPDQVV